MDDVGLAIRSHRLHAPDLLETQILPDKLAFPQRIHRSRSLLYLGYRILLPDESCAGGAHHYCGYLRRLNNLRLPDQVRLHVVDAISLWWTLDSHHLWLHGGLLPLQQHG